MTLISKILGFTGNVIIYGCVTHCTFEYLGDFVVCNGHSMEPTLYSNDILITDRISPRLSNISRGDIIIAKCPTNQSVYICKRVVGLAGDKINASESSRGLNCDKDAKAIAECENNQRKELISLPKQIMTVPRGQLWLEGDNQSNSIDSRFYGPIPEGLVKSRVLCRLWPFKGIKVLT